MMPLPRGYKVPDFITFSRDDDQSTMEHVSQFMAQCGEVRQNEFHKLQLFLLSLMRTTFTWYSTLPPNYMQNWANMETSFHDRFYWPQPEATVANLMNLKQ